MNISQSQTQSQINTSQSLEGNFFTENYLWLEDTILQVKKSYDQGKIAHGLLLVAPKDSGKRMLANLLANSILCCNSVNQLTTYCGQCKSCLLVDADSHPDLSIVDCLIDNKGKQKKSIGIDQIRLLTNKLTKTPQLGGWRIAIIMSVEKMTRGAFNAILKTLEEPREKILLLMLANGTHQVPATIRSRCQLLNLRLSEKNVLPWLTETTATSEDQAKQALSETLYAPFAAKNFIQNKEMERNTQFNHDMDQLFQSKLLPFEFLSRYSEINDSLWVQMANYFKKTLVSILKSNQGMFSKLPKSALSQLYAELLEYNRGQCSGSNLQVNLQLEAILIQWFEMGRKLAQN